MTITELSETIIEAGATWIDMRPRPYIEFTAAYNVYAENEIIGQIITFHMERNIVKFLTTDGTEYTGSYDGNAKAELFDSLSSQGVKQSMPSSVPDVRRR